MWKEVDEERYDEMLGMMWPALWLQHGFLVGEPFDHRVCKVSGQVRATYAAFLQHNGKFYEGPNMTRLEFTNFNVATL